MLGSKQATCKNQALLLNRISGPSCAALLLSCLVATPTFADPDFLEWYAQSGSWHNLEYNDGGSNWRSFSYAPYTAEPPPPNLTPSGDDTVYFDSFIEPGDLADRYIVDLYDPDDDSKMYLGGFSVGSGDWMLDMAGRDLTVNGYEEEYEGETYTSLGEFSVGSTPEISARLWLDAGDGVASRTVMDTHDLVIGYDPMAAGLLGVDDHVRLDVYRDAWIGYSGLGQLWIADGGLVNSNWAMIGGGIEPDEYDYGYEVGHGEVNLYSYNDKTSAWFITTDLHVGGYTGDASLILSSDSRVDVGGSLYLNGDGPDGDETREVHVYSGGELNVGDTLSVYFGGSLTLEGGVINTNNLHFAGDPGVAITPGSYSHHSGTMRIDGGTYTGSLPFIEVDSADTSLIYNLVFDNGASTAGPLNDITIARTGSASLSLLNGSSLGANYLTVASYNNDTSASLYLENQSTLAITYELLIGGSYNPYTGTGNDGGLAAADVASGSRVSILGNLFVGYRVTPSGDPEDPYDFTFAYLNIHDTDTLVQSTTFRNDAGVYLFDSGTLKIDGLGENNNYLELSYGGVLDIADTFNNVNTDERFPGLIVFRYGGQGGQIIGDGTLYNNSGATIQLIEQTQAVFQADVRHAEGANFFINEGSEARFEGNIGGGGGFYGSGLVTVAGTLNRDTQSVFGSTYFEGDLTLTDSATVILGLAGTNTENASDGYDWLSVQSGTATLDGTLDVRLYNDFNPTIGDIFYLIEAETLVGTFDQVLLPEAPVDARWILDYLPSDEESLGYVELRLVTTVPEPGGLAILLTGLALISTRRRR